MKRNVPFFVVLLLLLSAAGCAQSQSISTSTPLTPTAATTPDDQASPLQPTTPGAQPGSAPSTKPVVVPTVSVQGMNLGELPAKKDFIIYPDSDNLRQQSGIWAINPVDKVPTFIKQSEGLGLGELSPGGKNRLVGKAGALYIASPDGSHLTQVYRNDNYTTFTAYWMNDSTILFNAFDDPYKGPYIYMLNIDTGLLTPLDLNRTKAIQGAFPKLGFYIVTDLTSGAMEMFQLDGRHLPIFQEYEINPVPWYGGVIQWVDSLQEYVFTGRKRGDDSYKIWALSKDYKSARVLFDLKDGSVTMFRLSPDGQTIGFVYQSNGTPQFLATFVNVKTGHLDNQWPSPFTFGDFDPIWSPDSKYIACPYAGPDAGSAQGSVSSGIQIMDVKTGVTQVILNKNVRGIMNWSVLNP